MDFITIGLQFVMGSGTMAEIIGCKTIKTNRIILIFGCHVCEVVAFINYIESEKFYNQRFVCKNFGIRTVYL